MKGENSGMITRKKISLNALLCSSKATDRPERRLTLNPAVRCKKYSYKSRKVAKSVLKIMRASGNDQNKPGKLEEYLCPKCGTWHVGHNRFTG
jgi:predicted Zn-ribbon and HTH transcriptional regulator